ncbi:urease subunit beta [Aphanothece sacrum]|uniref:Urease subunit beta n=1 Tax=Aphanothece sacrum FPU1 TaxID=1920663 RepID=A0A401IK08_APHSA|nr:urease subunit beta [Aphanothece sacrum]GBF81554.1 urease subunit beta [Aphanothece sacrum FPU1]GBF86989.1 urease subunit beta [Aphanothece sacrum FPU3]
MIPGEIITKSGEIQLNIGRETLTIMVANKGDRPVQVGSHFHFYEVNDALIFFKITYENEARKLILIARYSPDDPTRGMRLNIPSGTAIRFEPSDEDAKEIELIPFGGRREIYGFNGLVNGPL